MNLPKTIFEKWFSGISPDTDEQKALDQAARDTAMSPKGKALLRFVRHDMNKNDHLSRDIVCGPPDKAVVDGVMASVLGTSTQRRNVRDFRSGFSKIAFSIGAAAAGIALLISSVAFLLHETTQPASFPVSDADAGQPVTVAMTNSETRAEAGVTLTVRFKLTAPEAKSVSIVGDFNNWDANRYPLSDIDSDGVWEVEIKLKAGHMYTYNFLVDGSNWIVDPNSVRDIRDAFGGRKSVLSL